MAKRCVICAQEIGFLDNLRIPFRGTNQNTCSKCGHRYLDAPPGEKKELEQIMLDSPDLESAEIIRADIEAGTDKVCSACGGTLVRRLKDFSIGADGIGGLSTLLAETFVVDLFSCTQCGKVELYDSQFRASHAKKESESKTITCPSCGTRHSELVGCPSCALRAARSGRFQAPRKPEKKPPWEK